MAVQKSTVQLLTFEGDGCTVQVTDQVVLTIAVPGGRQTINFPVVDLPQVHDLLATAAADDDVLAAIVANTPEPEPETDPATDPVTDPETGGGV